MRTAEKKIMSGGELQKTESSKKNGRRRMAETSRMLHLKKMG